MQRLCVIIVIRIHHPMSDQQHKLGFGRKSGPGIPEEILNGQRIFFDTESTLVYQLIDIIYLGIEATSRSRTAVSLVIKDWVIPVGAGIQRRMRDNDIIALVSRIGEIHKS